MADEGDDWFGGEDDEPAPVVKPLKKAKGKEETESPEAAADAPTAEGDVGAEGELPPDVGDEDYLDPDRLLLFKHWIRPKFLPYRYISLYRHIYYDDVIDYMDKRSRGIPRDIPHAETWAERLIRHCRDKVAHQRIRRIQQKDLDLVDKTKYSGHFFYYHNKPKFLPYKYIYEYRKNYYDDIMEVLASRRKGIRRNIPPAQTWAERICRSRSSPVYKVESFNRFLDDVKLVTKSEISGHFYSYYSKDQFNRRFSKLLY